MKRDDVIYYAVCITAILGWLAYRDHQAKLPPPKPTVEQRLSETDSKSTTAIDVRLRPLSDLIAKGRRGSKVFAREALSLEGKWELVKSLVDDSDSHKRYLSELFARHVFNQEEFQQAMEVAVRAYLDDVEGIEGELLVQLRADLATNPNVKLQHLKSDKEFKEEYRKLSGLVIKKLQLDLPMSVGREVGSTIAAGIATQAALNAAQAAAAELGISTGILGGGAMSSVATLGAGIVIALIVDAILDEVLKFAGYNPQAKIESLVCQSLNNMEAAFIGPKGKLRQQMDEIHKSRSKVRNEAIRQMLKGAKK